MLVVAAGVIAGRAAIDTQAESFTVSSVELGGDVTNDVFEIEFGMNPGRHGEVAGAEVEGGRIGHLNVASMPVERSRSQVHPMVLAMVVPARVVLGVALQFPISDQASGALLPGGRAEDSHQQGAGRDGGE